MDEVMKIKKKIWVKIGVPSEIRTLGMSHQFTVLFSNPTFTWDKVCVRVTQWRFPAQMTPANQLCRPNIETVSSATEFPWRGPNIMDNNAKAR
jgi:hypothetical protein